jgi:hypothetical protein
MGFVDPSSNLNRTVFETLLRGYLFIVKHEEADEYYRAIGSALKTGRDESYTPRRGMKYLRENLYTPTVSEKHKELYKILCISSHADTKGTALNYPKYLPNLIGDNLNMILSLMYGNIQMMAEGFFNFLNTETKAIIKNAMEDIAFDVGSIPLFEPDKPQFSSKLKLKNGNFLDAL